MKPEIERALSASGWYPGRQYDVQPWVEMLTRAGLSIGHTALNIWKEYGALHVKGESIEQPSSILFDPIEASSGTAEDSFRLSSDYGENLSPIGVWSAQYQSYVAESGWVMAIGPGWDWKLGRSLEEALDLVVTGSRKITCIQVTDPGARPFPAPTGPSTAAGSATPGTPPPQHTPPATPPRSTNTQPAGRPSDTSPEADRPY